MEGGEYDRRNYFMIYLHDGMGPGRDPTGDPSICSQTHYRLCFGAGSEHVLTGELKLDKIHKD